MSQDAPVILPNQGGHPSRLMLARLLAGDLDASDRGALEAHIRACAHCGKVFENAKLETAAFANRHPAFAGTPKGARPRDIRDDSPGWLERLRDFFDRNLGMRPAMAGFALLALVSVLWTLKTARPHTDDLTAKGGAASEGAASRESAKNGAQFSAWLNGQPIHGDSLSAAPMDTLQLALVTASPVHYAVLYRDDGGPFNPYMGGEGESQRPVGTPKGEDLPHSLVMGKGWNHEILYCLWASRPFTLAEAEAAAKAEKSGTGNGIHLRILKMTNRLP